MQQLGVAQARIGLPHAACGQQQQERQALDLAQPIDHLARCIVDPLPVVDDDQQWALLGQHDAQGAHSGAQGLHRGTRAAVAQNGRRDGLRQGRQVQEQGRVQPLQALLQQRAGVGAVRQLGLDVEQMPEPLANRLQGLRAQVVLAVALHDAHVAAGVAAAAAGQLDEALHQACLAHARAGAHRQALAAASTGLIECGLQPCQLALAAAEGQVVAQDARLVAGGHAGVAPDAQHMHRLVAPLQLHWAVGLGDEEAALRAQAALAGQNLTAAGQVAQARRHVGCITDQLNAAANQITVVDQHQAGMDTAVKGQLRSMANP